MIFNHKDCLVKNREIIYKAHLKDNTEAYFHFLTIKCKECLIKGLEMLSYTSRYFRFNSPMKKFSCKQLDFLTKIDYKNHLALGAGTLDNNKFPGMGIARYFKVSDNPNIAEIGITVLDEYQNKGLGSLLLSLLIQYGVKNNIDIFSGYVHSENIAMMKLLKKFNAKFLHKDGDLVYMQVILKNVMEMVNNNLNIYSIK